MSLFVYTLLLKEISNKLWRFWLLVPGGAWIAPKGHHEEAFVVHPVHTCSWRAGRANPDIAASQFYSHEARSEVKATLSTRLGTIRLPDIGQCGARPIQVSTTDREAKFFRKGIAVRHLILMLAGFATVSAVANGQSLRTLVTYKGADPTTCATPPLTQSFSSSDTSVNAYFVLDGVTPGQTVELHWFDPTNVYKWYTRWDPTPNDGFSSHCYSTDLNIASYIAPNWGPWKVQVYVNGQAIGSAIGFQVNSDPIEPRGPEYVGYFDPIEPGCSHLTGWAKDNGNPNAVVSVDIRVEGGIPPFPIIQATEAGKNRSGVGNYEWNLYNLQLYEDGQSHLVHVLYHGSPQELPGSPRYFPPPGALSACNGGISPLIRIGHVVTLPNSNGTIYYVHSTGLYPFAAADAFRSWGFQFSDVTTANSAEVALPVQTTIIPAKIPGCSDPIAQINGTCGSTPLSVSWVSGSSPPQSMTSGQSYQVKWQMAGPAQIQSRLCYGSSSDPATMCQQNATYLQSTGTNTSGVGTDSITAPTVTSAQTVYAVVQAQANGQTVYTQPAATINVNPSAPTSGFGHWVFDGNQDQRATGYYITIDRTQSSDGYFQYTFMFATSYPNNQGIYKFEFIMTNPVGTNIDQNSFSFQVNGNSFNDVVRSPQNGWITPVGDRSAGDLGSLAQGLIKGLPYKLNATFALGQYLSDLVNKYPVQGPTLQASSTLLGKIWDQNANTTRRYPYSAGRNFWGDQDTWTAVRFGVRVRELSNADWPDFFVLLDSQAFNGLLSLESLGSKRSSNDISINRTEWY